MNDSAGISVLFSGGPDSTLAALYALEKTEKVHLLTYHHKWMGKIGKHLKVVDELKRVFGDDRIILEEKQIDKPFIEYYTSNFFRKLPRYRTFFFPWLCGACKMAMHVETIKYNKKHNLSITYDGANVESSGLFPAQMKSYIDTMARFYQFHGMKYENPVYEVERTDIETEKYGLISTKNTKKEHVVFSTQHTCLIGLVIHAHGRLYYKPFRGKNRTEKLAGKFLQETLAENSLIDN